MHEAIVLHLSPPLSKGVIAVYQLQVAELRVISGTRQLDLALVLPGFGPNAGTGESIAAELKRQRPNRLVALRHSNDRGITIVTTGGPVDEFDCFLVAAGAAVIQYAWAWHETPAVLVTVNGLVNAIEVSFQKDKSYLARQVAAA